MNNTYFDKVCEKILYSKEEIEQKVKELGDRITKDYEGEKIFFISVLNGAFMFTSDLLKHINCDCEIDFMQVSTYGNSTNTSGDFKVKKDLTVDIRDKHVIVIEDILDTGYTMEKLLDYLKIKKPKSLKCCAFIDKPQRRINDVKADYVGFEMDNDYFIVGYGLDYAQLYRNLPYIGVLKEHIYS